MEPEHTAYAILGIPEDADPEMIRKAWRALAMRYHPDRNPGDTDAERRFKELSAAWETLGDAERRNAYDLELKRARAPTCSRCDNPAMPGQRFCPICMLGPMAGRPRAARPKPPPRSTSRPPPDAPEDERERLRREYGPSVGARRPRPSSSPRRVPNAPPPPPPRPAPERDPLTEARESWARVHQPTGDEILESLLGESALRQAERTRMRPFEGRIVVEVDENLVEGLREVGAALRAGDRLLRNVRRFFSG